MYLQHQITQRHCTSVNSVTPSLWVSHYSSKSSKITVSTVSVLTGKSEWIPVPTQFLCTEESKFSKTSFTSSMMVVQEQNFPAAPRVTLKPNGWKALQKQLHFPLLNSPETDPDATSALLLTKEIGKVTVEHSEDEQTVKESALCEDFAWRGWILVWILLLFVHHTERTHAGLSCSLLLQLCSLSCEPCACAACRDRDRVEVCLSLKSKTPAFFCNIRSSFLYSNSHLTNRH